MSTEKKPKKEKEILLEFENQSRESPEISSPALPGVLMRWNASVTPLCNTAW
uniref:Uncharacterized protein n=1 Tax=Magallana gigas TaxID=29159 RepID=K1PT60_MAGGI